MKLSEVAKVIVRNRPVKADNLVDAAKAYKKNIKVVLDKHLYFFRAAQNHSPVMDDNTELSWIETPKRTVARDSVFGNGNWLMSWVDANWTGYPRRSHSYFTTQSQVSAGTFGRGDQTLLIIPADDVQSFGIVDTDFNETSGEVQTLMKAIQDLYKIVETTVGTGSTNLLRKLDKEVFQSRDIHFFKTDFEKPTVKTVRPMIDALDELLENIFQIQQRHSAGEHFEERLIKKLKRFRTELQQFGYATIAEYALSFSPKVMGATLYTDFGQIKSSSSKDNELWFEGSYLGIYWHGEDDVLEGLQILYDKL